MSLQPADKKFLGIAGAVVVAVVAIIAIATTLLVRNSPDASPTISVAAGGHYERIEPAFFCTVKMEDCRPRLLSEPEIAAVPSTRFPVEIGQTLTLSVPSDVADSPWLLTALYATPEGIQPVQWLNRRGTVLTRQLTSTADRVLLGLEIRPFSAVLTDADTPDDVEAGKGGVFFRANYSVATAPENYPGPSNQTELPPQRG